MKRNITALLALLFIVVNLHSMNQDADNNNSTNECNSPKHKIDAPKNNRNLKKIKLHDFSEEEEPNNLKSPFGWDNLPDEIQLFILSFIISIKKTKFPKNAKEFSAQFKQYATLTLVNKKMANIVSDKHIFDLDATMAHHIQPTTDYLDKMLINAAKHGCTNVIELALQKGFPIKKNRDLLFFASQFKHIDLCKKLIAWGITEDFKNIDLVHAIVLHDLDAAKALIAARKSSALSNSKIIEVTIAAMIECTDIWKLLSTNDSDINAKRNIGEALIAAKKFTTLLYNEATELIIAAKIGNIDILKLLIAIGCDIKARDDEGKTSLDHAAIHGQTEIAQFLLDSHADINAENEYGLTPLHYAAMEGQAEMAQLLIDNHANINANKVTMADSYGDEEGNTPLHYAAEKGQAEMAQLLIDNHADINAKDYAGETPLHSAARYGYTEVVQLLVDNHAIIDVKNADGLTPSHYAAMFGFTELMQLLLDNHADIEAKDNNGISSLHYAAMEGYEEMVQLLLNNHANIEVKDNKKMSPLHYATREGQTEAVQLLLNNNADVEAKNNNGSTPLDLAKISWMQ